MKSKKLLVLVLMVGVVYAPEEEGFSFRDPSSPAREDSAQEKRAEEERKRKEHNSSKPTSPKKGGGLFSKVKNLFKPGSKITSSNTSSGEDEAPADDLAAAYEKSGATYEDDMHLSDTLRSGLSDHPSLKGINEIGEKLKKALDDPSSPSDKIKQTTNFLKEITRGPFDENGNLDSKVQQRVITILREMSSEHEQKDDTSFMHDYLKLLQEKLSGSKKISKKDLKEFVDKRIKFIKLMKVVHDDSFEYNSKKFLEDQDIYKKAEELTQLCKDLSGQDHSEYKELVEEKLMKEYWGDLVKDGKFNESTVDRTLAFIKEDLEKLNDPLVFKFVRQHIEELFPDPKEALVQFGFVKINSPGKSSREVIFGDKSWKQLKEENKSNEVQVSEDEYDTQQLLEDSLAQPYADSLLSLFLKAPVEKLKKEEDLQLFKSQFDEAATVKLELSNKLESHILKDGDGESFIKENATSFEKLKKMLGEKAYNDVVAEFKKRLGFVPDKENVVMQPVIKSFSQEFSTQRSSSTAESNYNTLMGLHTSSPDDRSGQIYYDESGNKIENYVSTPQQDENVKTLLGKEDDEATFMNEHYYS